MACCASGTRLRVPAVDDAGVQIYVVLPPPRYLRYRVNQMKKTIRKLVLRSETLRALDSKDLTHAAGGTETLQRETRNTCPAPAIVATASGGC